jgi:D-3-phosphoglycerate dehydrogenase
MKKFKVVITDREYENIDREIEILEDAGAEVFSYQYKDEDDIIRVAHDCDGMIMQFANVSERVINSLEKCKIISRYAIGVDLIDIDSATKNGICVANVPDYCIDEVSTHAIALILALNKKIVLLNNHVKKGTWDYKLGKKIYNLRGQTIGIVGFGRIAKMVIEKIKPFGMKVIVFDPFVPEQVIKELGCEKVEFDQLIINSDVVSIHVPLVESTKHMFNKEIFTKMKETAYLVNLGRGPVINENDLIWALQNKQIAGVGLDVTDPEPIQAGNPMLAMDNVIITPHAAYYSEDSQVELQTKAAQSVAQVLSGFYPKYLFNKEVKDKVKLREWNGQ